MPPNDTIQRLGSLNDVGIRGAVYRPYKDAKPQGSAVC